MMIVSQAAGAQAASRQTVSGIVRDLSGRHLADATVIVTMGPVRVSIATRSDSVGKFAVAFESATGDYLVYASAVGFSSQRKRITVPPERPTVLLDLVLSPALARTLDAVTVRAVVVRPSSYVNQTGAIIGASRGEADGVRGVLSADVVGDIGLTARTVAGVASVDGAPSVLGLPASQNIVTVDGSTFSAAGVPRAALMSQSVITSIWDPSRGGFAGAELATTLTAATPFETRRAFVSAVPGALSTSLGSPSAGDGRGLRTRASFVRSGEVVADRLFAQLAADVSLTTAPVTSLLSVPLGGRLDVGVTASARDQLLAAAERKGVPVGATLPIDARTVSVNLLSRFDWGGFDYRRSVETSSAWNLSLIAGGRDDAGVVGLFATPSTEQNAATRRAFVRIENNREVGRSGRNVASVSASTAWSRSWPWSSSPNARVITTDIGQTNAGRLLSLGGSGIGASRHQDWNVEAKESLLWNLHGDTRHRITWSAWAQVAGSRGHLGNSAGALIFNSLADFASSRPAILRRPLGETHARSMTINGAMSLGDVWRPTEFVRVIGGVRLDGNRFRLAPPANQVLQEQLGIRNDVAPSAWGLSPRLGVTWTLDHRRFNVPGYTESGLGRFATPARNQLRLGVGEFRSLYRPEDALTGSMATGLPDGARWLECVGDAVPEERWRDWTDLAGAPTMCRTGRGVFTDSAPPVMLLSSGFRPARSWRSTFGWTSTIRNVLRYELDATWSWQRDQAGQADLNFAGEEVFALTAEQSRPVFVPATDIDPRTAVIAQRSARKSSLFGSVNAMTSKRTGRVAAYTASVSTIKSASSVFRVNYTYSEGVLVGSGFDGPTQGDPRIMRRVTAPVPRHIVQAQSGWMLLSRQLSLTASARLQSGSRFTPIVGGDINGDGRANDAAFISTPAAKIVAVSGTIPRRARRCIERQVGAIAGIGSCEGPWQVTSMLQATLIPRRARASGLRWDAISVNMSNPLGAMDYMLHGQHLRGWGTVAVADPILLRTTSFDPVTRAYQYAVNAQFGSATSSYTRLLAPMLMTIEVTVGLDPHPDLQQLRRSVRSWQEGDRRLRRGADDLVRRYRSQVPEPYALVLADPDSLFLTSDQLRALMDAQVQFSSRADSLWRPMATYIATLEPRRLSMRDTERVDATTQEAWRAAHSEAQRIAAMLLKPGQAEVASRGTLAILLRWNESMRLRSYFF